MSEAPRELTNEERWAAYLEREAREGRPWRGRPKGGIAGILEFLKEGGTYGVGSNGSWIQIVAHSADRSEAIYCNPFYDLVGKVSDEVAYDLARTVDVHLAFPGLRPDKIRRYIESLRLLREMLEDVADLSGEPWSEAYKALANRLMDPATWDPGYGPSARRSFIRHAVEWRVKDFRERWHKSRSVLTAFDERLLERQDPGPTPEAEFIKRDMERTRIAYFHALDGLTAQDLEIQALFLEGKDPAEICRVLGSVAPSGKVDFGPWSSYKQKVRRKGPPKEIL